MKLLLLNNDVIINIIKHYLKSKNILYFCDLSLVCIYFRNSFNLFYKSLKFINFNIDPNIYYEYLNTMSKPDNDKQFKNMIIKYLYENKFKNKYYVRSLKHNIKFSKLGFNNCSIFRRFYLIYGCEDKLLCDIKFSFDYNSKEYLFYFWNLNNYQYIDF